MAKTNLTIQLDTDVIQRARVVAAKRGTSVSALVARQLTELVAQDERYEAAYRDERDAWAKARSHGGRTWTRDDLYAERLDRHGR
jgi:hypothetical protein